MKRWYRSVPVKAAQTVVAIVMAIVLSLSVVLVIGSQGEGSVSADDLLEFQTDAYEDSAAFESRMQTMAYNVLEQLEIQERLGVKDGEVDQDQLVDIMEYYESGEITGENVSGLAYKLKDLVKWNETLGNEDYKDVIVCEKPDGTYHYYYIEEFESLLENGELQVETPEEWGAAAWTEEVIGLLEQGENVSQYYGNGTPLQVFGSDSKVVYNDFWLFYKMVSEPVKPDGAESLLDVVNDTSELNGKLEDVVNALDQTVSTIANDLATYEYGNEAWSEGNTNFRYLLINKDDQKVYTNTSAYEDIKKEEAALEELRGIGRYVIVRPKLADFESDMSASASAWKDIAESYGGLGEDYVFAAAVDTDYPIQDSFYESAEAYGKYAPYLRSAGMFIVVSVILLIVSLVWLTVIAGRRPEDDELHLNAFDRWKTELGAAAAIVPWLFGTILLGSSWNGIGYQVTSYNVNQFHYATQYMNYIFNMTTVDVLIISCYVGITMVLFLTGYLSLVRRIKGKTLWKNSVLCWIIRIFGIFWKHRNVCLRTAVLIGGFILIHWITFLSGGYPLFILLMLAAEAAAVFLTMRAAIEKERIRKGIKEIASGNVSYQIPLEKLHGESREMAELVNSIGDGLNNAVADAMKSERLKTDLITNVSHDIKTPLTSIINYVDLLKRENLDDPKIQGYLEVLEAKAQRLKTLTEDVVEASKVSSGNITLEMMDVNLVEMVNQTIGEFSEKMEAKKLTVVASLPEEPAIVHVDGRRMWRVLENIFNNAAKYAMPGTRVYADLRVNNGKVSFSLKNVSENPLNISADELTERFIRGDVSRSTEGSGLGLSIARDLTQMQGGEFKLYVDGDLFKVVIEF